MFRLRKKAGRATPCIQPHETFRPVACLTRDVTCFAVSFANRLPGGAKAFEGGELMPPLSHLEIFCNT